MIVVTSNIKETERDLNRLVGKILKATDIALREIERSTVKHILDNKNWASNAVYKRGPQKGTKYDLQDSGRLFDVIGSQEFNTISHHKNGKITVGIGNISELDSLKTQRDNVSRPDFSYWRVVVYGRAAIPGWRFYQTGTSWGVVSAKPRGFSAPTSLGGEISSSEPTMMFENGFHRAKSGYSKILNKHLRRVL